MHLDEKTLNPPQARRLPVQMVKHGDVRVDEYFWLRERENPEVLAYLAAENDYTAAVMAHTAPLQEALYAEMLDRMVQTDQTAPLPEGSYRYYERTEEGKDYPILCRRPSPDVSETAAAEEILLDVNLLAAGHAFCHLGEWRVSPNGRLLAYTLDVEGSEAFVVHVKQLDSDAGGADSALLPERIPNAYYGLEWAADSQHLFYTQLGEAHRPDSVWRHRLRDDPAQDQRVFHEPDDGFFVEIAKTSDDAFVLIVLDSNITSEVWSVPAAAPLAEPQVIQRRRSGHEYSVDARAGWFYLCSNRDAPNFRVLAAPVGDRAASQEVVAHDSDFLIEKLITFAKHVVLFGRREGLPALRVLHMAPDGQSVGPRILDSHDVVLPEAVYTCSLVRNAVYDTSVLYFAYSSLKTPNTVYAYDMNERTLRVVKQDAVRGYDPAGYVVERLWATAPDGVRVPVSLVYRQGITRSGDNPCLLTGYGAYGLSTEARFFSPRISLLDRGFVVALAHVRGGSEMGRAWYEAGKMGHKRNSFADFIAGAELLIAEGFTNPRRLAISGRSAGGLLMGAVTNLRPDLFAAVLAGVPFVDVISTMLDPSIPLTTMEYDEWGNPDDPQQYAYMRSYSPYDNLTDNPVGGRYPRLLATAGLYDPRVAYWEPAKYVARLRSLQGKEGGGAHGGQGDSRSDSRSDSRTLLKTIMSAGHRGPTGRYEYLRETAFEYAFFLDAVGA